MPFVVCRIPVCGGDVTCRWMVGGMVCVCSLLAVHPCVTFEPTRSSVVCTSMCPYTSPKGGCWVRWRFSLGKCCRVSLSRSKGCADRMSDPGRAVCGMIGALAFSRLVSLDSPNYRCCTKNFCGTFCPCCGPVTCRGLGAGSGRSCPSPSEWNPVSWV